MNLNQVARRLAIGMAVALPMALTVSTSAQAQSFFRIGTGGTAGTYYPVGGMIANAVSIPGKLIATAQATNGSVANVNGVASGAMESGFSQSDVATWAQKGTGIYEGKPNIPDLRLIANLYPETIHVVVKKSSGIKSISELKGKRVALDEPGSGTLVNARLILAAYNIKESEIRPEYIKPNQAADKMKDGALDAFFFVGGYPTGAIVELASAVKIKLVPIAGPGAEALISKYGFFSASDIPEGAYEGVGTTTTVAVGAQWITSAKEDEALIYDITKALWNAKTRVLLDVGHAKGKSITAETALDGIGIPLHPGAERFYKEAGMLK
jgi:TRAP transporter TAXI family solute receptor